MSTSPIEHITSCRLPTEHGVFQMHGFIDQRTGQEHVALVMGDVADGEPVLSRIHSECLTGDALFSQKCDCGPQLQAALAARGIDCIFLIAPTTTPERIAAIAEKASGFIYYVSLKGVTGSARLDTEAVARQIALLRQYTDLPIGVGFGIRDAQSAAQIAQVADAVIVGSRIVQEIEKQPAQAVRAVADLVRELKAAV